MRMSRRSADISRSAAVPVDITHAGGTTRVYANQQQNHASWVLLGTYSFNAGTAGNVLISNEGTTGYVIVDAVRFVGGSAPPAVPSAPSGLISLFPE